MRTILLSIYFVFSALSAQAAELIMIEEPGCKWCQRWTSEIGPIYPKSAEGQFAPLRLLDIRNTASSEIEFVRTLTFTPTFVLVEGGKEVARMEGYPGEDFFWGLLDMMLTQKTSYKGGS